MKKETSSVKFWKCAIGCTSFSWKWNDNGCFIPKGWVWRIRLEYARKMGLRDMAIKVSRCQHGKKKKSHGKRFTKFCKDLSSRLNIADGFRTLWIEYDREPLKGTYGENKIHNLTFNSKYVKGKHVLLIDDVITTGSSLVQIGKKLLELGAASVRGIFMARTVRDTEMVV